MKRNPNSICSLYVKCKLFTLVACVPTMVTYIHWLFTIFTNEHQYVLDSREPSILSRSMFATSASAFYIFRWISHKRITNNLHINKYLGAECLPGTLHPLQLLPPDDLGPGGAVHAEPGLGALHLEPPPVEVLHHVPVTEGRSVPQTVCKIEQIQLVFDNFDSNVCLTLLQNIYCNSNIFEIFVES